MGRGGQSPRAPREVLYAYNSTDPHGDAMCPAWRTAMYPHEDIPRAAASATPSRRRADLIGHLQLVEDDDLAYRAPGGAMAHRHPGLTTGFPFEPCKYHVRPSTSPQHAQPSTIGRMLAREPFGAARVPASPRPPPSYSRAAETRYHVPQPPALLNTAAEPVHVGGVSSRWSTSHGPSSRTCEQRVVLARSQPTGLTDGISDRASHGAAPALPRALEAAGSGTLRDYSVYIGPGPRKHQLRFPALSSSVASDADGRASMYAGYSGLES